MGEYTVRAEGHEDKVFPYEGREYHEAKAAAFQALFNYNAANPNMPVTIFLTQTDSIYEYKGLDANG